jgi:hypothetical protein
MITIPGYDQRRVSQMRKNMSCSRMPAPRRILCWELADGNFVQPWDFLQLQPRVAMPFRLEYDKAHFPFEVLLPLLMLSWGVTVSVYGKLLILYPLLRVTRLLSAKRPRTILSTGSMFAPVVGTHAGGSALNDEAVHELLLYVLTGATVKADLYQCARRLNAVLVLSGSRNNLVRPIGPSMNAA